MTIEDDDFSIDELRMSIATALEHANRVHKSYGCIGCDWCTLKSLLDGYNADEDIREMREWLTDKQAAFKRYRDAEKRFEEARASQFEIRRTLSARNTKETQ